MLAGDPNASKLAFSGARALLKSDMRLAEHRLDDVVLGEGGVGGVESPVSAKDRQTLLRREEATSTATELLLHQRATAYRPHRLKHRPSARCGVVCPLALPQNLPARVHSTAFAW